MVSSNSARRKNLKGGSPRILRFSSLPQWKLHTALFYIDISPFRVAFVWQDFFFLSEPGYQPEKTNAENTCYTLIDSHEQLYFVVILQLLTDPMGRVWVTSTNDSSPSCLTVEEIPASVQEGYIKSTVLILLC